MKKIIIALALVFTGNMGFTQEAQTSSKCQNFVSNIFLGYNLPLPETGAYPTYPPEIDALLPPNYERNNLENYDQEKPEFTIKSQPIFETSLSFNTTQETRLKIEGKILEDGSYILLVSEIKRNRPIINTFILDMDMKRPPLPLVHTFRFSENCEFNGYSIRQSPSLVRKGFFVYANMECKFNEPYESEGLTAYIIYDNLIVTQDYMILKYPDYYRGLCALARDTE